MAKMAVKPTIAVLLLVQLLTVCADKPCQSANLKEGNSNVCVCTADYCDEISRDTPGKGSYVTYQSSESGLRFQKKTQKLQTTKAKAVNEIENASLKKCTQTLHVDSSTLYQSIEGFGGAVTDAAGINWARLSGALRQKLIDSYYGKTGIEYNMARVPIGGSDFSTHPYAYNESPVDDARLANFSLSSEDYDFKLPMLKQLFEASPAEVHLIASTWSPPAWMKTNNAVFGFPGALKPEYYQTYADYHLKFIEEYEKEGIPVWAITTTNEPTNPGLNDLVNFNTLGWMVLQMGTWIASNLGPTIRNSPYKDIKIICNDDQRNHLAYYFNLLVKIVPDALQYIDGVGTHFYFNTMVPPDQITYAMKDYPDKFIMSTEACAGAPPAPVTGVDLGSWGNAQIYMRDILESLNYNLTAWVDWNMCLSEEGGPNWVGNFVDSPIIVSDDGQKIYKQPMYYALGHVAKFLPRGSRRVKVTTQCENKVDNVVFLTPEKTIVTVLHNTGEATQVHVVAGTQKAVVQMEKNSIATVEFAQEG